MGKLPNTPPSLKAWEDGWCEISLTDQKFTLIEEDSFLDLHFRSSLRNTLVVLANSIDNQLRNGGLDVTDKEIFRYLLRPVIDKLCDFTSQSLVKSGKDPTSVNEIWEFIGTLMFRSGFNGSSELAWKGMAQSSDGFEVMNLNRFTEILLNLRGYDVIGRAPSGCDDTWNHWYV